MRVGINTVFLLCLLSFATTISGAETKINLQLSAESAKPGEIIMAAVQMQMPPGWHSYWTNSGDSGSATEIAWTLPEGISAEPVQWPLPQKHLTPAGARTFYTYVLEEEAILLIPLKIAADISPGPKTISAKVSWQECETVCILGTKTVTATLVIGNESKPSPDSKLIEAAQKKLPQKDPELSVVATLEKSIDTVTNLALELPSRLTGEWDFFPYKNAGAKISGKTEIVATPSGSVRLEKEFKKIGAVLPAEVSGILVQLEDGKPIAGYEITVKTSNAKAAASGESSAGIAVAGKTSLVAKLLSAFLGGLILNFMPCVLPVISLKVLSFVNQTKETPARGKMLGLVYGMGVLVSFLVLAAIAIGVQKAGGAPSWSMALQNQTFRVVLTVLMTLIALNLFGVFEVTLGGAVMNSAGRFTAKEGFPGAFFNGALATVLATACTAPILAGAIGFAFTQKPTVVVLMFLMVGLGLAAPFVILCWKPKWLRILPKPGAWMERFKIAMGYPMLATAAWIFSITAPRFGKSGVLWFGLFLVILSAAAWIWGEFVQRGHKRKGLAIAIFVFVLGGAYIFAMERRLNWREPATFSASTNAISYSLKESSDGIDWQPWSLEAVAKARAEGHPVLVDFTADTCINCQLNKATSLEIRSTRAKLNKIDAVAFLGDFTDNDPRIAAELKRYQRAGVPLVLVFPKNPNEPAIVLPPILTPGIVADALDKAAK